MVGGCGAPVFLWLKGETESPQIEPSRRPARLFVAEIDHRSVRRNRQCFPLAAKVGMGRPMRPSFAAFGIEHGEIGIRGGDEHAPVCQRPEGHNRIVAGGQFAAGT